MLKYILVSFIQQNEDTLVAFVTSCVGIAF